MRRETCVVRKREKRLHQLSTQRSPSTDSCHILCLSTIITTRPTACGSGHHVVPLVVLSVIPSSFAAVHSQNLHGVSIHIRTLSSIHGSDYYLHFDRAKGSKCPNLNAWLSIWLALRPLRLCIRRINMECRCVFVHERPLMNEVIVCILTTKGGT